VGIERRQPTNQRGTARSATTSNASVAPEASPGWALCANGTRAPALARRRGDHHPYTTTEEEVMVAWWKHKMLLLSTQQLYESGQMRGSMWKDGKPVPGPYPQMTLWIDGVLK
jgi:hypothetical protein